MKTVIHVSSAVLTLLILVGRVLGEPPSELVPWLTDQTWQRDVDGPVLSLGRGGQPHAVQQSISLDGIEWTDVSPIQISRAYAPSVVKTDGGYEMWYTQPGA
ncbi:MAG TPA: hypothetical protein VM260_23135 [Pirellula sp.]|nr:hypothetical protein [Pirellula sp.]